MTGFKSKQAVVQAKLNEDLAQPEHHPQHSHTLQQRLAELHLYEEINEHYAKCSAGAENLRDWVAERVDIEPVQPATKSELNDAFAQGMSCRPASAQRPWVGLTDEERASFEATLPKTQEEWDKLFNAIEAILKEKNT